MSSREQPGGEEGASLVRTSQPRGNCEAASPSGGAGATSLRSGRAAAGTRPPVIGGLLLGADELGSVGRGDWPRPAAVRMQAGCSGLLAAVRIIS